MKNFTKCRISVKVNRVLGRPTSPILIPASISIFSYNTLFFHPSVAIKPIFKISWLIAVVIPEKGSKKKITKEVFCLKVSFILGRVKSCSNRKSCLNRTCLNRKTTVPSIRSYLLLKSTLISASTKTWTVDPETFHIQPGPPLNIARSGHSCAKMILNVRAHHMFSRIL